MAVTALELSERINAVALDDTQKLAGCARRMLLATLPLADRAYRHIEKRRYDRLADAGFLAHGDDLGVIASAASPGPIRLSNGFRRMKAVAAFWLLPLGLKPMAKNPRSTACFSSLKKIVVDLRHDRPCPLLSCTARQLDLRHQHALILGRYAGAQEIAENRQRRPRSGDSSP